MGLETTILISKELREELRNKGRKGQTYNEIILKLLEQSKFIKNNSNLVSTPPRTENQTAATDIVGVR